MKKRIFILVAIFSLFGAAVSAQSIQGNYKGFPAVNVEVNGQKVESEIPGINMEGTTLVPLRMISESLGAQVRWNEQTSTASIVSAQNSNDASKERTKEDKKVELYLEIADYYAKLEQFGQEISRISESLQMAQEHMKAAKNTSFLLNVKEIYLKHLAGKNLMFNDAVINLQKDATKQQIDITDMFRTMSKYSEALTAYGTAAELLQQYYNDSKQQTLDNFTIIHSSAYDTALKESMTCYKKQLEFAKMIQ